MGCGGSSPVQDAYGPPTAAAPAAPSPAAPAACESRAAAPAAGRVTQRHPLGVRSVRKGAAKLRRQRETRRGEGTNGSDLDHTGRARIEGDRGVGGDGRPGRRGRHVQWQPAPRQTDAHRDRGGTGGRRAGGGCRRRRRAAPAPAAETAPLADEKPRVSEIKPWKDLTAGLLDELMGEAVETEAARATARPASDAARARARAHPSSFFAPSLRALCTCSRVRSVCEGH